MGVQEGEEITLRYLPFTVEEPRCVKVKKELFLFVGNEIAFPQEIHHNHGEVGVQVSVSSLPEGGGGNGRGIRPPQSLGRDARPEMPRAEVSGTFGGAVEEVLPPRGGRRRRVENVLEVQPMQGVDDGGSGGKVCKLGRESMVFFLEANKKTKLRKG